MRRRRRRVRFNFRKTQSADFRFQQIESLQGVRRDLLPFLLHRKFEGVDALDERLDRDRRNSVEDARHFRQEIRRKFEERESGSDFFGAESRDEAEEASQAVGLDVRGEAEEGGETLVVRGGGSP